MKLFKRRNLNFISDETILDMATLTASSDQGIPDNISYEVGSRRLRKGLFSRLFARQEELDDLYKS